MCLKVPLIRGILGVKSTKFCLFNPPNPPYQGGMRKSCLGWFFVRARVRNGFYQYPRPQAMDRT